MLNSRKLHSLLLFTFMLNAPALHTTPEITASSPNNELLQASLPPTDSKKQKARMRKTHSEKKRKIHTYRDMTYEELLVAKDQHVAQKNYTSAIKYLDQMIKLSNDITIIAQHLLEIADLLYLEEIFQKAAQKYAEYAALYPGGDNLEYALFRAIDSSFACTLTYDRDQTKTEETLALAENFLKQDHFTTYKEQVTVIRDKCYQKLADSELNICWFYVNRGRLVVAQKRIDEVRATWLPKLPDIEPTIIALEADVLAQQHVLEEKKAKNALLTENKTKQKHMAERF